jgi:hypothetical protein
MVLVRDFFQNRTAKGTRCPRLEAASRCSPGATSKLLHWVTIAILLIMIVSGDSLFQAVAIRKHLS